MSEEVPDLIDLREYPARRRTVVAACDCTHNGRDDARENLIDSDDGELRLAVVTCFRTIEE